jgi:hypothetical protein
MEAAGQVSRSAFFRRYKAVEVIWTARQRPAAVPLAIPFRPPAAVVIVLPGDGGLADRPFRSGVKHMVKTLSAGSTAVSP